MNAFFRIYVILISSKRNRSRTADGLAFQTFSAGVEFPNLIANHALKVVVLFHIHCSHFYGVLKTALVERLNGNYRNFCLYVQNQRFVNQLSAKLGSKDSERNKHIQKTVVKSACKLVDF